ncbi:unnamed protein product, partial [Brassica rapa subsp. trilocularis]
LVAQFDHFLRQGYPLMLINFSVTHSCGSYRSTTHAYMISFLSTTRVRSCEQLPEDLSGFEPVKYKYVLDGTLNPDYLVDIIGQIVEISHIDHINVNGKETEKISLEFDERLPMVLWGKFACDVCEAMRVQDEHSTVLVLRFGKIKVWKEDRSLSNAYNVSNPPIIEVRKFIASLPKDDLPLAIVESKNSAIVNGVSAKDDFFILTPRKTIAQILETKQESEDGQFHDLETQSDAPEVSLAIQGLPSKQSESFDMTPAKRIRAVNIHTEEILDDNTVTRSVSSVKIKKEKFAKSG